MQYGDTPKFIIKLANAIDKVLLKLEMIAVALILTGLLIQLFSITIGGLILSLTLTSLATIYFFMAYTYNNTDNNYDRFILRLVYWSYSIAVIGVLFIIQVWPVGILVFQLAKTTLILSISFIIILGPILKKLNSITTRNIIRTLVILLVVLLLYLTPSYKQLKEITRSRYETESTK